MSKRKIKKIVIKSFRGIPNTLSVDFVNKDNGVPLSTIIYGGNGSGKSTIVDALEFCVQGRIERSEELRNNTRPSVINYFNYVDKNPEITVTFDDDSICERKILIKTNSEGQIEYELSDENPHPDFNFAPIVLRRNDIITYNYTKGDQRLLHILQYFYNKKSSVLADNDVKLNKLQEDMVRFRKGIKKYTALLSEKTGLPIDDLNDNRSNVVEYFRRFFIPKGGNELKNNIIGKDKQKLDPKLYLECEKIAEKIIEYSIKEKNGKKRIKELKGEIAGETLNSLKDDLIRCEQYLLPAFKAISRFKNLTDIKLSVSEFSITSLDIKITLDNGLIVTPNEIFSEANFDLLILIFYMSMIKTASDKGQSNVLILDDVLQSVDASIREQFVLYYFRSKEFKNWQFIITCHDKLWLRELEEIMQIAGITRRKVISIDRWTMNEGPVISSMDESNIDDSILDAITTRNSILIAQAAGRLLEKICNQMTQHLGSTIHRTIGDKYTLIPLLDSFRSSAKLIKDFPELSECLQEVYDCKYYRNFAAHSNMEYENMNDENVLDFADSVQKLYNLCFCKECYSWLTLRGKEISCDRKCKGRVYHIK